MLKAVFEITVRSSKIPVYSLPHISEAVVEKVSKSKKFIDYFKKIEGGESDVQVSSVEILGVEMFGEKVGFVSMKVATKKSDYRPPNFVFLRGPAVAILLLVNKKLLLVEQYRVPVQQSMLEAPAGMLDESGDFIGVAAQEIKQQTGINLTSDKLISLGSFYPSPGGCDQEIFMFYADLILPQPQLDRILSIVHGNHTQRERIKLKIVDYHPSAVLKTKDVKLIALMYAYENRLSDRSTL